MNTETYKETIYKHASVSNKVMSFFTNMSPARKGALVGATALGTAQGLYANSLNKRIPTMSKEEKRRRDIDLKGNDFRYNVPASIIAGMLSGGIVGGAVGGIRGEYKNVQKAVNKTSAGPVSKFNMSDFDVLNNHNYNKASEIFGQNIRSFTKKDQLEDAFLKTVKNVPKEKQQEIYNVFKELKNTPLYEKLAKIISESMSKRGV